MAFRVVHYINQFFANVGGEEMAHIPAELREGKVGPGAAFETAWKGEAVVVNTIVCGDSFFAEHEKEAKETVVISLVWWGKALSMPPAWMSISSPRCFIEIQEHSICQPG